MRSDHFRGYIEGYYGKKLSWKDRKRIVIKLKSLNLNYYFYTPKEELKLRKEWKRPFSKKWLDKFNNFCNFAKSFDISVIAGISPGLNFNFSEKSKVDFNILLEKVKILKSNGASVVSILYDDIPEPINFDKKNKISEGKAHAFLCNKIYEKVDIPVTTVPRIYSDEIKCNNNYLCSFIETLNKNVKIFYCGKFIVSNILSSFNKVLITQIKKNNLIFWNNVYCNDYCPSKLFLGPSKIKNYTSTMVNLTGMIETDMLLLDIIFKNSYYGYSVNNWKKIILKHKIPKSFFKIYKFFNYPCFSYSNKLQNYNIDETVYTAFDELLWNWKSKLAREWYPFLLNMKQDLQLLNNELDLNRILKIHTFVKVKLLSQRKENG